MAESGYHVDEDDNVIGKATRMEIRKKNLLHRVVIIFVFNSEGEILVMKRSATKDKHPSLYELNVAGMVSYGEDYDEAAKRELYEEVGCDTEPEFMFRSRFGTAMTNAYRVVFDGPLKLQESEVDSAYFVPLENMEDEFRKREFRDVSDEIYNRLKEELGGK